MDGWTDRQAGRQTDRQAGRQAGRQADRQTHRQADRQTETERERDRGERDKLNPTLLTERCTVVRSAKLNNTLLTENCTAVKSAKLNHTLLTERCSVIRGVALGQVGDDVRLIQLVIEPEAGGVVVVVSVLLWLTGLQDAAGANSRSQQQRCYQPGGHGILRVDLRNGQRKVQSVFSLFCL